MLSGLVDVRRVTPVPEQFADDADDAVLRRLSGRGDAFAFLAGGNTGGSISDEDVDGVRLCGELFVAGSTGLGGGSACVGEPIVVAGSRTEERLIESCAFTSAE
uniref:Uncharacterized protein n=1 Tax=Parascaris equorum TaxID=6256 RepID=A0A914RA43_PAREQ